MMILSFLSLAIGLGLPIIALVRRQQKEVCSYIYASFVAYGAGSWLQYSAVKAMVIEEDLNGLFDTVPTMQTVLGVVLLATLFLNGFLWLQTKKTNI